MRLQNELKLLAVVALLILSTLFTLNSAIGVHTGSAQGNLDFPWYFMGGNQQNTWFSPQTMINPANVAQMKLKWSVALPEISGTPVVSSNGIVYVAGGGFGPGSIYAIKESDGALLWDDGPGEQTNLSFSTQAGVAVANGEVFVGTLQNYLISLNASTGSVNWEVSITQGIVGNPVGYYLGPEATPLVYNGQVIIADTEGDIGARGFIRSFSETNGAPLWTFYTVPPSPIDSYDQGLYLNTWGNCTDCGGGDIWNTPAIDPSDGLLFFGTGNPAPSFNSSQRSPDPSDTNLYTDSVIALNATDGGLVWYFQEVPSDSHDWDQGMPVALFTTSINNTLTKVVGAGSKGGYYYLLNAKTGSLIWKKELGIHLNENSTPTPQGVLVYPGSFGGVNSFSSYDPTTNMIYVTAYNQPNNFTAGLVNFNGGEVEGSKDNPVPGVASNSTLYALNASSGLVVWSLDFQGVSAGASSTNELVFTSDGSGTFYALDAQTGKTLWKYATIGQPYLGLWSWGAPSVSNGTLFETLFGQTTGGVLAFTSDTSIVYTANPPPGEEQSQGSIDLRLLSSNGSALTDNPVSLALGSGLQKIESSKTNSTGWVEFGNITSGNYLLEISTPEGVVQRAVPVGNGISILTITLGGTLSVSSKTTSEVFPTRTTTSEKSSSISTGASITESSTMARNLAPSNLAHEDFMSKNQEQLLLGVIGIGALCASSLAIVAHRRRTRRTQP